jgi:bifunctional non-homologous end joining protein LigD
MQPTDGPLPTAPGWSFEFKWDGLRAVCGLAGGELRRLQTRLGNDLAARFPKLADVGVDEAVLDGELVVLDGLRTDFDAVERRRKAGAETVADLAVGVPATVMVFDVLALGGEDLRRLPYAERRSKLEELDFAEGWVVPPVSDDGQAVLATSMALGLEGVVAKKTSSRYQSGRRSRDWIKVRHNTVFDVVVVGWERRESGGVSLLLAEPAGSGYTYAGRCTAPRLIAEDLAPLAVRSPVVEVANARRGVQ